MVVAQGGDPAAFEDRSRLPTASLQTPVVASTGGFVARLDALTVARAGIALGAGRERKGDPIDLSVGVALQVKLGDQVERGQTLAVLHANDAARLPEAERLLREAVTIGATAVAAPPLILERISA
jgi:thymidine phosphorylase